jgi:hypothetical protein
LDLMVFGSSKTHEVLAVTLPIASVFEANGSWVDDLKIEKLPEANYPH